MATIEDLRRLIEPPAIPVAAAGDWAAVEAELGLKLPSGYKELVTSYGLGGFDDLSVLTPLSLLSHARDLLEVHRSFRDEDPEEFPYPLYPEQGGLLEWACTGNGDRICWLTVGDPEQWPVIVWNLCYYADRYDVSTIDFMHGYFSGQLAVENLREVPVTPWFDPYRDRSHVYVRLSEGELSYEQRLAILRDRLAPTADRGNYEHDGARQDHFKVVDRDWLVTYESAYGHQIRIAFPPADDQEARRQVAQITRAMGCDILGARTIKGEPVWFPTAGSVH